MDIHDNGIRIARLGALALGVSIAGCAGASSSVAPTGQSVVPQSVMKAGGAQHLACAVESTTYNFNGTKIAGGDWVWFTSTFTPNNYVGKFLMADNHITFTEGTVAEDLTPPDARISLHADTNLHFNFTGVHQPHGTWWLMIEQGLNGNTIMNAFAWQVPPGGTEGGEHVTWSMQIWSGDPSNHVQWQWAAAAYSQLPGLTTPYDYNVLNVKPSDATLSAFPEWDNNDPAGTPEAAKAYVIGGAGGGGGNNYTGGHSGTLQVTPCQGPKPPA